MRKLFLFLPLFFMIYLTSCNSEEEDESTPKEENAIVGKWEVEGININGETEDLNACTTQSTVEFFSNGSAQFSYSGGSGDCVIETSQEKWEHLGNNIYEFTEIEDGEKYKIKIEFSNNNNITTTEENLDGVIIIDYRRI